MGCFDFLGCGDAMGFGGFGCCDPMSCGRSHWRRGSFGMWGILWLAATPWFVAIPLAAGDSRVAGDPMSGGDRMGCGDPMGGGDPTGGSASPNLRFSPERLVIDVALPRTPRPTHQECVDPLVDATFEGIHGTLLAYGQTGSGKTYTMGTSGLPSVPPGALQLAIRSPGRDALARRRSLEADCAQ